MEPFLLSNQFSISVLIYAWIVAPLILYEMLDRVNPLLVLLMWYFYLWMAHQSWYYGYFPMAFDDNMDDIDGYIPVLWTNKRNPRYATCEKRNLIDVNVFGTRVGIDLVKPNKK